MSDFTPRGRPGRDLYAEVTARIIEALERGVAPWVRPWKTIGDLGGLRNAASGYLYSGINVMLLGLTMDSSGLSDPRWLTYQQAKNLGGQVRRGECGTPVVFWKPFSACSTSRARPSPTSHGCSTRRSIGRTRYVG